MANIHPYLKRLESLLHEFEHQIKWSTVSSRLARGECVKCKKPVVVQQSEGDYTTVTKLLGSRCTDS